MFSLNRRLLIFQYFRMHRGKSDGWKSNIFLVVYCSFSFLLSKKFKGNYTKGTMPRNSTTVKQSTNCNEELKNVPNELNALKLKEVSRQQADLKLMRSNKNFVRIFYLLIFVLKKDVLINLLNMNKIFIFFLLGFPIFTFAQPYAELTDTQPRSSVADWKALKKNYLFAWGNTDTRYPKHVIPNKQGMQNNDGNSDVIRINAWAGEQVNLQALLYTKSDLAGVSFNSSGLKSGKNSIPASAVKIHPVYYVMTDALNKDKSNNCGYRPDHTKFDSSIVADVLDNQTENITVSANSTRPIWLTVKVPSVQPGKYVGLITVNAKKQKSSTLKIELTVENRSLPAPSDWSFRLDLWQNPYAVARYHNVPLWSKDHFDYMRPLMKLLANAGQKTITTSIMYHPWAAQTYDAFKSMITRTKNLDGSWDYTYDVFDKWVNFMMNDVGITTQINCYTMIPWALNFDYFDRATNSVQFLNAKPGSEAYKNYWLPFLKDFAKHLKNKGWFHKTTIAMDERPMRDMQDAIKVIKAADSDFKVSLAGNYHAEIEPDIYDYCIAYRQNFPAYVKANRLRHGKVSTYYTCCTEAFPNTFTFSPPAEATWIGWHAAAGNYDGYLRWAYNSWTEKPLQDSRFRAWPGGDCYLVYPDGRSSIRFQRLIEGIQDYEKIKVLQKEFANQPDKLKLLNEKLAKFTEQGRGQSSTEEQVREARHILNMF